jgi:prophage regulatory protein
LAFIVNPIEANRLVRLPEVIRLSGMSRATIYRHMEEGTFPKPKRVGVKMIAWKMSDLINWIDGLESE